MEVKVTIIYRPEVVKAKFTGGAGNDIIQLGSASSYASGDDGDDTMYGRHRQ